MVQVFECGGDKCAGGGEHVWDGPEKTWTNPCARCDGVGCARCGGTGDGGGGSSATCSKCGLDAMTHTLMGIDETAFEPMTRLERIDTFVAVHLVRDDGTSWCAMSRLHGSISAWPATDQSTKQPDEVTCKACLGRYHRSTG